MPDTLTPEQRQTCMAAIHGKDTKPERIVRSLLHRLGFRFRLHSKKLPGKPDIVLRRYSTVIFVHGCFWHVHTCKKGQSKPIKNAAFWERKRSRNQARDRRNIACLKRDGWRVLIIWECQTRNLDRLSKRLLQFLAK